MSRRPPRFVGKAECFLIGQGYTDLPPTENKSELSQLIDRNCVWRHPSRRIGEVAHVSSPAPRKGVTNSSLTSVYCFLDAIPNLIGADYQRLLSDGVCHRIFLRVVVEIQHYVTHDCTRRGRPLIPVRRNIICSVLLIAGCFDAFPCGLSHPAKASSLCHRNLLQVSDAWEAFRTANSSTGTLLDSAALYIALRRYLQPHANHVGC